MATVKMIIEFDTETDRVRVGHPPGKMLCDFMLAEARRILDRQDDLAAAGEGNGKRIVEPPPFTPSDFTRKG